MGSIISERREQSEGKGKMVEDASTERVNEERDGRRRVGRRGQGGRRRERRGGKEGRRERGIERRG